MIKAYLCSLALLVSASSVYGSYTMNVKLFRDNEVLEEKSGPTKTGNCLMFEEGVEVRVVQEFDEYAVVQVLITNDQCPQTSVNECKSCECCKGGDMQCPQACQSNDCCEQGCCESDAATYDIPYNQEFTIKCPSCQYSLHITIAN